jgi:hypothetical protein
LPRLGKFWVHLPSGSRAVRRPADRGTRLAGGLREAAVRFRPAPALPAKAAGEIAEIRARRAAPLVNQVCRFSLRKARGGRVRANATPLSCWGCREKHQADGPMYSSDQFHSGRTRAIAEPAAWLSNRRSAYMLDDCGQILVGARVHCVPDDQYGLVVAQAVTALSSYVVTNRRSRHP